METNSKNPGELQSKIALVTGGTKGIGRAIANKLSQEGAQVIVTARRLKSGALFHSVRLF